MGLEAPVLFNACLAGALAGLQSTRQPIHDASGVLVQPADFLVPVEVAENFSTEEQAALYSPPLPTVVPSYVSSIGSANESYPPVTALDANAAQSLPVAMAVLSASIFDGRNVPYNAAGSPEPSTFFSVWANSVGAMTQSAIAVMQQS
jgi:hypothetical protein